MGVALGAPVFRKAQGFHRVFDHPFPGTDADRLDMAAM